MEKCALYSKEVEDVITYHRYQQGRLASRQVINSTAVRNEAEFFYHGEEIFDHSFNSVGHVA